jgi:hypothetical protein
MIGRFREGEIRDRAIRTGLATEEGMDAMIDGLERWMGCEDASMGLMHGEIIIEVI